jgi:ankyrin repeat protein
MLKSGTDPNYPHNGFPSIATALGTHIMDGRRDHLDIVRLLIAYGADINARDVQNWTPLHYAVRTRNLGAVELLLAAGADATLHDLTDLKSTPVDLARMLGFDDAVGLFEAD